MQVWISYAKFELTNPVTEEGLDNVVLARRIFERGNNTLRESGNKESRALLLEAWRDFENNHGDDGSRAKIIDKMPRRVKRRRRVVGEDKVNFLNPDLNSVLIDYDYPHFFLNLFQSDEGWEEVFDFIFPEDESQRPHLKVLASAKAWKQKAALEASQNDSEPQEINQSTESTTDHNLNSETVQNTD